MITECDCPTCKVARKYEDEGVPQGVIIASIRLIKVTAGTQSKEFASKKLDGMLAEWLKMSMYANEMIDKGILRDEDFQQAVESPDPTLSFNLYQRIKDYAANRVN